MTRFKMRRVGVLASAALLGIGVAGCGGGGLSASQIAHEAQTRYNQQFAAQGKPQRVTNVSCPRDLQAKVGASEVCSATGNPGHVNLNITATVTSVHGSTSHLEFRISVPRSSPTGTSTGTSTG